MPQIEVLRKDVPAITVAGARKAAVGQIHAALRRWIEEQGWEVGSPLREYYLQPPRSSHNPVGVMEIQYPLR